MDNQNKVIPLKESGNSTLVIVSATRLDAKRFREESALGNSLERLGAPGKSVKVQIAFENARGLPDIYNDAILRADSGEILVFVHDDVWIDDPDFCDKVREGIQTFDIVGVAGNKRCIPGQPSWAFVDDRFTWDEPKYLSGAVAHGKGPQGTVTEYGETPAECQLLDGVLLAAPKEVLDRVGVLFDPRFDFHFYDLDFCQTARGRGLSLGTWPIALTHESGGSFGSDAWRKAYKKYLDKWIRSEDAKRSESSRIIRPNRIRGLESKNRLSHGATASNASNAPDKTIRRLGTRKMRGIDGADRHGVKGGETLLSTLIDVHTRMGGHIHDLITQYINNKANELSPGVSDRLRVDGAIYIIDQLQKTGKSIKPSEKEKELKGALELVKETLEQSPGDRRALELQGSIIDLIQNQRYQTWRQRHGLKEVDGQFFAERVMYQWSSRPVFHFVLFLFPGDEALLGDTLDSLGEQLYQDWRLTVVADYPAPDPLWDEIDALRWLHCGSGDDPYQLVNDALRSVESDWVSFIEAGTRWSQHALLRVGDYANSRSCWSFVYSDTDNINAAGERSDPRFLPDVNLDMLRSMPYCRQGAWVRRDVLLELGGIEPLPGCEMHDLALKVIETQGEAAVGHIADVLVHAPKGRREPDEAIVALTVKNHLERSGVAAVVGEGYLPGTLRINYLHAEEASVSIIIPTRDRFEYIESCLKSLLQRTVYDNFDVIVADMGSTDPDTLALYEAIDKKADGRVSVVRFDADISGAGACNRGAMLARGEYLLFLKDQVEAKQAQWLSRLMLHAQRPEVGIVGPRIIYPESTFLADAGMVLGMDDVVGKPFVSQLTLNGAGYMSRAQIDQNYSAVSDTCLVIRKSLFTEIGGMDSERFGKDFIDVDLCLRAGEAGYKVVWTPFSLLMAYKGNATINERGKGREYLESVIAFDEARDSLLEKWLPKITNDPAYNPNLDLSPGNAFLVNDKLPLNWDNNFHDRTRVLGLPLRGGSGDYRIIQPFDAISDSALQQTEHYRVVEGMGDQLKIATILRMAPDVLVVQAGIDDMHVGLLDDIARYRPEMFRIFSLDDLITEIPEKSSVYKHYTGNFRNARARIRKALSLCDRMIVTTRPLADAYADMIDDIRVIPNRLRRDVWLPLESKRGMSTKPRVGWVGAQQHAGDLEIIVDVVKQTADKVDWVFMGMCPEEIRPFVREYDLAWVSYDKYPRKMASLNLDIAVAPLEIHSFNEAKSNLRLLEYGILGWPVVCTDIVPYQSYDAPVRRVPNETGAWIEAIMDYANDLDRAARDGDKLQRWVKRHFILEDHLDEWVQALTPTKSRAPTLLTQGASKVG